MIRATLIVSGAMLVFAAAAHAQAPVPCSLLTVDQIKAVLNSPVEPGQPGEAKGANDCTWSDANGEDRVYLALKPKTDFRPTREKMQKVGTVTPVTGVGEDAFLVATDAGAALYVLSKDHFLLLTVTGPDASNDANEAAEKALATQIVRKL